MVGCNGHGVWITRKDSTSKRGRAWDSEGEVVLVQIYNIDLSSH